jgi:hypothetical protein
MTEPAPFGIGLAQVRVVTQAFYFSTLLKTKSLTIVTESLEPPVTE